MSVVLLPENVVAQKLNRDSLPDYCDFIKARVEALYANNTEEYILQDGCPYANGELHLGHFLNKTLKDFYIKYYLVNGYKVRVSFGWDCHGLPIENKARFMEGDLLENCANIALKYRKIQSDTLSLFGIFSTEEDYLTLSNDFIQRELAIYNQLKAGGFIFKKSKPTWYSPALKTVLANSEIEYKDVTDESLYFKFKWGGRGVSFLVWTTTEWTVHGNQAICANPNIQYCVTSDNLICSERFAKENGFEYNKTDISKAQSYFNHKGEECPILFDEFVSDTETGLVHLSGGHGDEDYDVLIKHNITPKNVVDDLNDLEQHIKTFKVQDEYVFKRVPITHSYPVDWRVKEKVVKVLTEQTYLEFDWHKIKSVVKQIKLSGKDRTRLEGMLFSRKDWCLSRQRWREYSI